MGTSPPFRYLSMQAGKTEANMLAVLGSHQRLALGLFPFRSSEYFHPIPHYCKSLLTLSNTYKIIKEDF